MLRQIKHVMVPTGSTNSHLGVCFVLGFFDGVHAHRAHTCTHMHAHTHMQTFELCNSAFVATIRANASLDMLKPTLLWDTQRSILFYFFSRCKRQQGAGHLIDTNKLLSIWKSVYTRMWTSTTLKKKIPDVSWCLNSYKSDYTVNTHPTFTCLKLWFLQNTRLYEPVLQER